MNQLTLGLEELPRNTLDWSGVDYIDLHCMVFENYLKQLEDSRTSVKTREDILEWIAEPLRPTREAIKYPLTFQACCLVERVDPEAMQELLLTTFAGKTTG